MTSTSLDHTDLLGGSIREIAEQKAGIVKSCDCFTPLGQHPEVIDVLERAVRRKGVQLRRAPPMILPGGL